MRPGDFYDLSRYLAIRFEESICGTAEQQEIPVFLCHPIDLPTRGEDAGGGARGVLYLHRVSPDARYRQAGSRMQPAPEAGLPGRSRRGGLWVNLRYVFMIVEATPQEEMGSIGAALQFLHSSALLPVGEMEEFLGKGVDLEIAELPVEIVEDREAWRELGLPRHQLAISFEVSLPLASQKYETVERVLEREVRLERVLNEGEE